MEKLTIPGREALQKRGGHRHPPRLTRNAQGGPSRGSGGIDQRRGNMGVSWPAAVITARHIDTGTADSHHITWHLWLSKAGER